MIGWWAEAFITLHGIPSSEAFGVGEVVPGSAVILLESVPSSETFGLLTLRYPQTLTLQSVPSSEGFGMAKIGQVVITPGVPSAEAFGNATLTPGPTTVQLQGVPSSEAFGNASVQTAVLFGAVGASNNAFAASTSWNHTAAVGDRILAFAVIYNNTAHTGATYDGQAMTLKDTVSLNNTAGSGSLACYEYIVTAGHDGMKTCVVNAATNTEIRGNSISLKSSMSSGAAAKVFGTGTSLSQGPVTCTSGQRIVQAFGASNASASGANPTSPTGGTNRYASTGGNRVGLTISDSAATATFAASLSPTNPWGGMAIVVS
jgi:hypothetical protein